MPNPLAAQSLRLDPEFEFEWPEIVNDDRTESNQIRAIPTILYQNSEAIELCETKLAKLKSNRLQFKCDKRVLVLFVFIIVRCDNSEKYRNCTNLQHIFVWNFYLNLTFDI